ncbi:MAG: YbaK/EbsC family protein [Streptosporangiaceae bacterium]
MTFSLGILEFAVATSRPDLLADPVRTALADPGWPWPPDAVGVAEIDPDLADTAAFCEKYQVSPAESANCVVITGRRDGAARFAACVVLATTRADVNNVARRVLDVRKASFAPMDEAVALTGMEYGGITPIGLPADWPGCGGPSSRWPARRSRTWRARPCSTASAGSPARAAGARLGRPVARATAARRPCRAARRSR